MSNVTGYYPIEVKTQLRMLSAERRTTIQQLLAEAIDDLFAKYNRPQPERENMENPDYDRHLHEALDAHNAAAAARQRNSVALQALITEQSRVSAELEQASAAMAEASTAIAAGAGHLRRAFVQMGEIVAANEAAAASERLANQLVIAALRRESRS